jgi:site-specific recombinase XerD
VESSLANAAQEWTFSLRAKNLSPATIRSYNEAVRLLDEQLDAPEIEAITRRDLEKFVIAQGELHSAGTALTRFRSLRVFFNWALEEELIDVSPMERMKEPKGDQRPPDVPSDEDISRLFQSLAGTSFNDRRDLALIRFLIDTGCRIGEVVTINDDDLDFSNGSGSVVVFGKGRRARIVPFGNKTAKAILAYRRERRRHSYANLPQLFLSQRGSLTYHGAYAIIRDRASAVGLRLHPHQTRHFFAHTWLRDGGTEGDLRAIGGWESNVVMRRYGASAASERAREAHKRLSPGDRL